MGLLQELVVKITGETHSFDRSLVSADRKVDEFTKKLSRLGTRLTTFVTLPVLGAGVAFVKAASDAEETNSKFNAVFKDQANTVRSWAEEFSKSVGRATVDNIGFLATLQDTFVPLGFARDRAADLSKSLVALATDLASFNNLRTADVVRDLQSAVVGNTETLRKYGVVASQAAIVQEAITSGLIRTASELDATTKAQAIYNLIVKGTGDAQGDAIRTADSFANQVKALQASFKDLRTELGELLIPVVGDLVAGLREGIDRFNALDDSTKRNILRIGGLAAAVGPAAFILAKMVMVVRTLRTAFVATRIALLALDAAMKKTVIGLVVSVVVSVLALLAGTLITVVSRTRRQKKAQEELNAVVDDARGAMDEYRVSVDNVSDALKLSDEHVRLLGVQFERSALNAKIAELGRTGKFASAEHIELNRQLALLNAEEKALAKTIAERTAKTKEETGAVDDASEALDDFAANVVRVREEYGRQAFLELDARQFAERLKRQAIQETVDLQIRSAQLIVSFLSRMFGSIADIAQSSYDRQLQDVQRSYDGQIKAAEGNADEQARLQDELAAKQRAIQRDAARTQKTLSVFQALNDTAGGIINALTIKPAILVPKAVAFAAITGAAQLAAILSRPLPALAEGGFFKGPAIVAEGGVPEFAIPLRDDVLDRLAAAIARQPSINNVFQPVDNRTFEGRINEGVLVRFIQRSLDRRQLLVPQGSVVR